VLFTANPMTGSRDEMVVESNWGLGESVVSGKSMNDFYILDKGGGPPKTAKVARKTVMFDLDREKGKGRTELQVPADKSEAATLDDPRLAELADIGRRIETLFGFPQDIEWAYAGGELYILQSRNIKNLQG
jgi:phosphoenolpyruvate synthase/pyruvate phosphate dikinase